MRSLFLLFAAATLGAQDAKEIILKSVEIDQVSWARAKDYAWTRRVQTHDAAKNKNETTTFESIVLYGHPYSRLVARNDRPLSPAEQKKQQESLDKAAAGSQHESTAKQADREKAHQRAREFTRRIPEIYDFKIEGEDALDGRPVWVISAVPKPGYKPAGRNEQALQKFRGKLWIDKAEYQWVRVEAEIFEPVTWGLFLVKLNPGSHILLEQTRVNNEVWLPSHQAIRATARLMFKHLDLDQDVTFSNYRKFQADSKVVGTAEPWHQ